MTGEMASINQDGLDSNGETWDIHAAIAKALNGELKPFDVYQGPYIKTRYGTLWVYSENGYQARVFNESAGKVSEPFPMYHKDTNTFAESAAREVCEMEGQP